MHGRTPTDISRGDEPPLKIAYLINQYPQPSQSFIRREILGLEALGHTVERFTIRRFDGKLPDATDQSEQEKTRVILSTGVLGIVGSALVCALSRPDLFFKALGITFAEGRTSDRGLLRHLICLSEACVLARWLGAVKFDHLHAHFGTNSTAVAMLASKLSGVPFSFTVHGPEEFDRAPGLGLRTKAACAKAVIAISDFGRGQLMRWTNAADWRKLRIVRCGLDAHFLDQPVTPPAERPVVVCVGRLVEQKAQLVLVEAAAILKQRGVPIEVRLIGDGDMRPMIEAAILREGLQDRVMLLGARSAADVLLEIQNARVVAQPSLAEGLPVALMEALALARPVVTTQIAGIPELVDASCGWLVPAGSPTRLADALAHALSRPTTELHAMGLVGRARVKERHDIQNEVSKLASILAER
jgi:glycosyltransferase involved in cell wall biosynthesis